MNNVSVKAVLSEILGALYNALQPAIDFYHYVRNAIIPCQRGKGNVLMNDVSVKAVYDIPVNADMSAAEPERPAEDVTFDERKFKEKLSEILTTLYNAVQPAIDFYHYVRNAVIPSGMSETQKADLQSLYQMIAKGFLKVENQEIVVTKALRNLKGVELQEALGSLADEVLDTSGTTESRVPDKSEAAITELLRADFIRADITPESRRKLENPNGGLWELWERIRRAPDGETVRLEAPVYARPPKLDVAWNDVIGIDFGTKSTVVARMTNGAFDLVRVGTGDYKRELRQSEYENPTILQFIDLDRFLSDFHARDGRPMTRWADVNTSHTALNARKELSDTDGPIYLPSFFGELKQWASGERRNINIKDRRDIEEKRPARELRPFLEAEDKPSGDAEKTAYSAIGMPPELNPIAYYAYYIGLYINNMRMGKIHLKYLLSFPVSYSKAARRKILKSFETGLKKSLPQSVLDDRECMESFYVREGAAEPAAYAVCALKTFGVRPEPGRPIRFAVFDFGGGTSDFDLGLWRRPEGAERRRGVRYVIEHLAYGGSDHLGGENLLWEMAYQTFRDNADALRKESVQFTCPSWLTPEPGFEFLIDNKTLEAQVNVRTMSELLRPVWEGNMKGDEENGYYTEGGAGGGYDFDAQGIANNIPLFNENGAQKRVQIQVSVPKLLQLIRKRIEEGVAQFIGLLQSSALKFDDNKAVSAPILNIFLAGNSAKSEIFRETIRTRVDELNRKMREIWGEKHRGDPPDTFFEIFAPLGSEEAERRIREAETPDSDLKNATGKTGVALGLLLTRSGSNIKSIDATQTEKEIRFRFWLGESDDTDRLCPLLTPQSDYEQWVEYWDAGEEYFSFYYTDSPTAGTYQEENDESGVKVWDARTREMMIPKGSVNEDWHIYLRPVGPDTIECAVAESADAAKRDECQWRSDPIRLE